MTLADRLRAKLDAAPAIPLLEHDVAPRTEEITIVPAAVLIAVTERDEPGVILTVRREHLRTHAGQVAFPGGRIDPGESATMAAMREASEEVGLDPALVDLIGELPPYRTITCYDITPVIGVVPPDLDLTPQEHEVADWFEVPLAFLLDPANRQKRSALFEGQTRSYYEIGWGAHRIWGATAAMIVNLSRRLSWP